MQTKAFVLYRNVPGRLSQRKMLVLVNGNEFKIDRQQHNSTSNFVSANSLIAKFISYEVSSIASLCINVSDKIWYIHLKKRLNILLAKQYFTPFFCHFTSDRNNFWYEKTFSGITREGNERIGIFRFEFISVHLPLCQVYNFEDIEFIETKIWNLKSCNRRS